jgi:hypothetical protein
MAESDTIVDVTTERTPHAFDAIPAELGYD